MTPDTKPRVSDEDIEHIANDEEDAVWTSTWPEATTRFLARTVLKDRAEIRELKASNAQLRTFSFDRDDLVKKVHAFEAELAALRAGRVTEDWQPIESAPDEVSVLIWDGDEQDIGMRVDGRWWVESGLSWPTLWMPLPAPPPSTPSQTRT